MQLKPVLRYTGIRDVLQTAFTSISMSAWKLNSIFITDTLPAAAAQCSAVLPQYFAFTCILGYGYIM